MCIRDRRDDIQRRDSLFGNPEFAGQIELASAPCELDDLGGCLLYTSDAADERSSVDLGGRRIIKKKTNTYERTARRQHREHNRMTKPKSSQCSDNQEGIRGNEGE